MLSERRALQPYGMNGGQPGARGLNLLNRADEIVGRKTINLGGKNTVSVVAGDRLTIYSPGGGGFGPVSERDQTRQTTSSTVEFVARASGSLNQYTLNQESV